MFSEAQVDWPPLGLIETMQEMHKVKRFRLAFCLETAACFMFEYLQNLIHRTRADVEEDFYDFLLLPPVVFSRTLSKYESSYL